MNKIQFIKGQDRHGFGAADTKYSHMPIIIS